MNLSQAADTHLVDTKQLLCSVKIAAYGKSELLDNLSIEALHTMHQNHNRFFKDSSAMIALRDTTKTDLFK